MRTVAGKRHLLRRITSTWLADSIALGIGTSAATINDTSLQFETVRTNITSFGVDLDNSRVVAKATIPSDVEGMFYEVGAFSGNRNSGDLLFAGRIAEQWSGVTSVSNSRVNNRTILLTPAANATTESLLQNLLINLSNYSDSDLVSLAYFVANAFTSSIKVRFGSDDSNYYEMTVNTPTAGYKISAQTLGSLSVVGSPDLSAIAYLSVKTTSTAGGSASVYFDALRIDDVDAFDENSVLIDHSVLPQPVTKIAGVPMDIEFPVRVDIT